MDRLTLSIRNYLAQQPDITALLGKSAGWDTWIFADKPHVKVEQSGKSMVVIQQDNGWTSPNEHNTLMFPRIFVDVWSDPDRNADKSVKVENADDKIIEVQKAISKYLHTVSLHSKGMPLCWGTKEQMDNWTGALVSGSKRTQETVFSNMTNNPGGRMGSTTYGVNLL